MKSLIALLFIILSHATSFSCAIVEKSLEAYYMDPEPIFIEPMRVPPIIVDPIPVGPSQSNRDLQAALDSQVVRLNQMQDIIDSLHLLGTKQERTAKKLEFQNDQLNDKLNKSNQDREDSEKTFKLITVILAMTTGLGLMFMVLWAKNRRPQSRS